MRWFAHAVYLLLAICFAAAPLQAQTLSEYDVEAAYLYNFGKFVRWPAAASSSTQTFDICILGQDPFGGTLDRLIAHDQISGKLIRKRIISRPSDATGCAIVYISDSEAPNLRNIISQLGSKPDLLVSGLPNFVDYGGDIQFLLDDDRVRFEINLDAASKCGLGVSSELLKVASSVTGKPRNGEAK